MSSAIFDCPHCGQRFNGFEEDAGVETECPSCGKAFALKVVNDSSGKLPNGFMCYLGSLKNYFGFKGRMRRRSFWWTSVFWWGAYLTFIIVDVMIWGAVSWCTVVYSFGTIMPFAAAQVRRLHDTNKSGWWLPLVLLCPINIAYIVWLATDGDKGRNRFGPDPKGRC